VSQFKKLDNGDWAQNVQLTGSNVPDSQRVPIKITSGTAEPYIGSAFAGADGLTTSTGALAVGNYPLSFNGSTWDRWRNNMQGTIFVSAVRAANALSSTQTNYNAKGVTIFLDVTVASGTGGLTVYILGVDPVSGKMCYLTSAPTAVTTTGKKTYELYPGISGTGLDVAQRTSAALPRNWVIQIVAGDGSSYTYSVGYSLIL
jgi:hypothetical protein